MAEANMAARGVFRVPPCSAPCYHGESHVNHPVYATNLNGLHGITEPAQGCFTNGITPHRAPTSTQYNSVRIAPDDGDHRFSLFCPPPPTKKPPTPSKHPLSGEHFQSSPQQNVSKPCGLGYQNNIPGNQSKLRQNPFCQVLSPPHPPLNIQKEHDRNIQATTVKQLERKCPQEPLRCSSHITAQQTQEKPAFKKFQRPSCNQKDGPRKDENLAQQFNTRLLQHIPTVSEIDLQDLNEDNYKTRPVYVYRCDKNDQSFWSKLCCWVFGKQLVDKKAYGTKDSLYNCFNHKPFLDPSEDPNRESYHLKKLHIQDKTSPNPVKITVHADSRTPPKIIIE